MARKPVRVENHSFKRKYRNPSVLSASIETPQGWHCLELAASEALLNFLADLSTDRRHAVLDSLLDWFRQERKAETKRLHGTQAGFVKIAWDTARLMAPVFLRWAEQPENQRSRLHKRIVTQFKKDRFTKISPKLIAAFLVRTAIENFGNPWPGPDPCVNPREFFRKVQTSRPLSNNGIWLQVGRIKQLLTDESGRIHPSIDILQDPANTPKIIEAILGGEKLGIGGPSMEERCIQTSF